MELGLLLVGVVVAGELDIQTTSSIASGCIASDLVSSKTDLIVLNWSMISRAG